MCESLGLFIIFVGMMVVVMYGLSFVVGLFDSISPEKTKSETAENGERELTVRQRLATTRAVLQELRSAGKIPQEVQKQIDVLLVRELRHLPDADVGTWLGVPPPPPSPVLPRERLPLQKLEPANSRTDVSVGTLKVSDGPETDKPKTDEQRARNPGRALIEAERKAAAEAEALAGPGLREPDPDRLKLSDMLRGFMEERNIRWVELISALLIVGCAVGLVISLWATLQQAVPYFPALLFLTVTAGIHQAGMYTLRRWKLKSTSRALLAIAALLVPLSYLTIVALSQHRQSSDTTYWVTICLSTLAYGWMTYSTGKVLYPAGRWWLWLGVMGPSVAQLLIGRWIKGPLARGDIWILASGPVLCAILPIVWLTAGWRTIVVRRWRQVWVFLALCLFPCILAGAMLVAHAPQRAVMWREISPFVSLLCIALLGVGLVIQRRYPHRAAATLRTTGTWLAVLSALAALGATASAWPVPQLVLVVSLANGLALTGLAWRSSRASGDTGSSRSLQPASETSALLLIPAALQFALALCLGWAMWSLPLAETISAMELFTAIRTAGSSLLLTVLSGIFVATAWFARRRPAEARWLIGAAGMLSGISVLLAIDQVLQGSAEENLLTLVFALNGLATLGICLRQPHPAWAWMFIGLLWLTCMHALVKNGDITALMVAMRGVPASPGMTAFLVHATLLTIAAWLFRLLSRRPRTEAEDSSQPVDERGQRVIEVCQQWLAAGLFVPVLGASFAAAAGMHSWGVVAGYGVWCALLWFACAVALRSAECFAAAQFLGMFTVVAGALSVWPSVAPWAGESEARRWEVLCAVITLWSCVWLRSRKFVSRFADRLASLWPRMGEPDVALTGYGFQFLLLAQRTSCVVLLAMFWLATGPSLLSSWGPLPLRARLIPTMPGVVILALLPMLAILCRLTMRVIDFTYWVIGVVVLVGLLTLSAQMTVPISLDQLAGPVGWTVWAVVCALMLWQTRQPSLGTETMIAEELLVATDPIRRLDLGLLIGLFFVGPLLVIHHQNLIPGPTLLAWSIAGISVLLWPLALSQKVLPDSKVIASKLDENELGPAFPSALCHLLFVWLAVQSAFTILFCQAIFQTRLPIGLEGPLWLGPEAAVIGPWLLVGCLFIVWSIRRRTLTGWLPATLIACLATIVLLTGWHYRAEIVFDELRLIALLRVTGLVWTGFAAAGLLITWWRAPSVWSGTSIGADAGSISHGAASADFNRGEVRNGLALAMCWIPVVLAVWSALEIVLHPTAPQPIIAVLGNPNSHILMAITLGVILFCWRPGSVAARLLALSSVVFWPPLIVATLLDQQYLDGWNTYRLLASVWLLAAIVATLIRDLRPAADPKSHLWRLGELEVDPWGTLVEVSTVLVAVLSLRAVLLDPLRPWSTTGWLAGLCLVALLQAILQRSQARLYLAAVWALLATATMNSAPWVNPVSGVVGHWSHVAYPVLGAFVCCGLVALVLELWSQWKHRTVFDVSSSLVPLHHLALAVGLTAWTALTIAGLIDLPGGRNVVPALAVSQYWLLTVGLAALSLGSNWDRRAAFAHWGLWATSILAGMSCVDRSDLPLRLLPLGSALALWPTVMLTAFVWSQRHRLSHRLRAWGVTPARSAYRRLARRLPVAQLALLVTTMLCAMTAVLSVRPPLRLWGAVVAVALIPALVPFHSRIRFRMRLLTLWNVVTALFVVMWSLLSSTDGAKFWLDRGVVSLLAFAAATCCGTALVRLIRAEHRWFKPVCRFTETAAITLTRFHPGLLILEWQLFRPTRGVLWEDWQIVQLVFWQTAAIGSLLYFAVWQSRVRGPVPLLRRQSWAVYTAELNALFLFCHMYLARPEWFRESLQDWWPLIVLGVAFTGVAVGELCRVRSLTVLGDPFQKTAALLPLLPALAFWVATSRVDYSTVLFLVGVIYVLLSRFRTSDLYAAAAGIAGNAGLWALWHEQGTTLVEHPQVWLIPPAVCALVAAQLNQNRLKPEQLTAIRYAAMILIYVSSAGEMFITGVAESLLMPMVLAALSVAGAFVGIMLRVRAFLYLGTSFLGLAILSMVAHASQNIHHVWPWWTFGITLGLALLTAFATFERHRPTVLQMLDDLQQWEQ